MKFSAISALHAVKRNIVSISLLLLCTSQLQVSAQSESDLLLTKTVDKTVAGVDDLITFTITIKNNGPATATNVRVTDVLASGYTFVSATPSTGSWSVPIWSIGDMEKDATASMILVAKINPFGNYTNTAAIKANEPDPNLTDNYSKISIGVIRAIDDYLYVNSSTGGQGIGNILINDFLNGYLAKPANINITQLSTSNPNIELDISTGKINVIPNTPPGNYVITYRITDKNNSALSSTASVNVNINTNSEGSTLPIEAKSDEGFIEVAKSGIALFNVLANDFLAGAQASTSNVNIELVSVSNPGISLDINSGSISVADNLPLGAYSLIYKISSKADASISATGAVTINVIEIGTLKLNDDFGSVNDIGGVAITNVLDNDLLNGTIIALADVDLELVFDPGFGITLDTNTGEVRVPPGTPNGVYTLGYKVTEKAVPTSFATADAIITVTGGASLIEAKDDIGTANGTNGGIAIENVLANDDLEGSVPLLSQVYLSQTAFNNSNGNVNLDFTTGRVIVNPGTPNGTYSLGYIIEDRTKPGSSSFADAIVTVSGGLSLVTAIEDEGSANSVNGGIAVANVLLNDDFKGDTPLISEVSLTQLFSNNAGVRLDETTGQVIVDQGTENGVYTVAYRVEDKNDPENFSFADVIVTVTEGVPLIMANADSGTANGTTGGVAVSNVLANDLLGILAPRLIDVNLSQVSSSNPGVSLSATGEILVAQGTMPGTYNLEYQIEDKVNPGNLSTAIVTVTVTKTSQIIANNDTGKVNGTTGGTGVANVLANDILEGAVPLLSEVILTETFFEAVPGTVRLDVNTGRVKVAPGTPAGFWTISYRIEDKANPGSFSEADATVEVTDDVLPLVAANDYGTIDGLSGGVVVSNILTNDTFNGSTVSIADVDIVLDSNPHAGIDLNIATGEVNVAPNTPAGVYTLVYTVKDKQATAITSTAYIEITVVRTDLIANNDSGTINGISGGIAVPDVLINDTLNGNPADLTNVDLSQVSASHSNILLDPLSGKVEVAANTPAGIYYLVYKISEKANPANSDEATVEVTVSSTVISAVNDAGTVNGATGGEAVNNILSNDLFNGATATLATVDIKQISTSNIRVNIDITTGRVLVGAETPAGIYKIVYTIADKTNSLNVATAEVAVTVIAPPIAAADDNGGTVNGIAGGVAVPNILVNDTYNGSQATLTNVIIEQLSSTNSGVTIDPLTGAANVAQGTPPDTYSIDYRIIDRLNPGNIAVAKVLVTVTNFEITPANDVAIIDGQTAITAIPNILLNDKVNGIQATLANVIISNINPMNSNITFDPLSGAINVAAGILPGVYTFNYRITDVDNSANTNTAEIRITVSGLTRIGLAKTVSAPQPEADGSYTFTYNLTAKNYGNTTLSNVSVNDDLRLTFPSPLKYSIIGNVSASGTLIPEAAFDGNTNISLLRNTSTLLPGATATISFTVNVKLNKTSGTFLNKAIATAVGSTGETVTDESTDGTDPDPNGNDVPDESVETPVELKLITVYIPEGFSPNNDGVNDKFTIRRNAGDQISLEIYNRWGNIVYKNADYKNEWDGRSNQGIKLGEDLPDGTYFYIVIVNGKEKFVRYITLKR